MLKLIKTLIAAMAAALLLMAAQCSNETTPEQTTETLIQVQNAIKIACGYQVEIASIAAVAATITSAVVPGAGETATVLVSVGGTIVADICKAVQQVQLAKKNTPTTAAEAGSHKLTVVVNGVTVTGTLEK